MLGVAYRSLGCEDEVVFAEDFVLDEEMSRVAGLTELNAAISQLARRFRALNVDREEFVMLKAIALTNSGTTCLDLCTFTFLYLTFWPCHGTRIESIDRPVNNGILHVMVILEAVFFFFLALLICIVL